jgi:hypothetical protein
MVLAALYALGMLNYWVPTLRFTAPLANALIFSALQLIPFILLVFALAAGPWWARILWCILFVPLAAFAGIVGACGALQSTAIVADGVDASFERLDVVPLPTGHLAIYRTNGGATTSFGISVRQECRLLPGLLRVRHIWGAYPAYEVRTQILAPDRIQFSSPAYGDRRPGEIVEEVDLKPMWCSAAG